MRVPVPFDWGGQLVTEVEFKRARGAAFAEARRVADSGNVYNALAAFVGGALASVNDTDVDAAGARMCARAMPYVVCNWAAVQAFLMMGVDGTIDQMYQCPRCHSTFSDDPESVFTIQDLAVTTSDGEATIALELQYPIEVKNSRTGEAVQSVLSLSLRYPTIADCARACSSEGMENKGRLQYAIYSNATVAVNGAAVDDKWRTMWGLPVFERMDLVDLREIGRQSALYGYAESVAKRCPKCSKVWDAQVDLSSFFAAGLRVE